MAMKITEKAMFIFISLFIILFESSPFAYSGNDFLAEMDEQGLCALTFDDGPSQYTGHLLDMMAEENVKATFFVLGENAMSFPDIIKRELKEGHEVASHGWAHANLNLAKEIRIRSEVELTNALLKSLGAKPNFFRPPYGNFTPYVEEVVNKHGMAIAIWSHDSLDWKRLPKSYAALRPGQSVENRHGVFLFHDIHKKTVDDFPRIVRELRASGCQRFVTLSEYMEHVKEHEDSPALLFNICLMRDRHAQPDYFLPSVFRNSEAFPFLNCQQMCCYCSLHSMLYGTEAPW